LGGRTEDEDEDEEEYEDEGIPDPFSRSNQ
jgi:hypothetical protein